MTRTVVFIGPDGAQIGTVADHHGSIVQAWDLIAPDSGGWWAAIGAGVTATAQDGEHIVEVAPLAVDE